MTLSSSSVISFLILAALSVCCGERVGVKIINPDGSGSMSKLHLLYQTTETVVCVITNALLNPVVTFGFQNPWINNQLNLLPIKHVEFVNNRYNVNVTITFNTTANMHRQNMVCRFAELVWTANIDMYFPPLLTVRHGQMPSIINTTFEIDCQSISVPESNIEWYLFGVPLVRSGYNHTEKQTCNHIFNKNFGSNSFKYVCQSNVTVFNLTRDVIGSKVTCASNYLGEISSTVNTTMDFYYTPLEITVESRPIKAVDDASDGLIEMSCTTSATNLAPTLKWVEDLGMMKYLNMSQYPVNVTKKPPHNGHLIKQTVQLSVNKEMNGKNINCCLETSYTSTGRECASTDIQVPCSGPAVNKRTTIDPSKEEILSLVSELRLTKILYPSLEEYKVYKGSDFVIPCFVDSHPMSLITWYKHDSKISDNNGNKTNLYELNLINIQKSDSGSYNCTAQLYVEDDLLHTISKTVNLIVIDEPPLPMVHVINSSHDNFPSIIIATPQQSSQVPQTFYLQYKKHSTTTWLEFSQPFSDTLPGQKPLTHVFKTSEMELQPGQYKLRVKSLALNGMVTFTIERSFQVKGDKEEKVTKTSRTNAVLISMFVTIGVLTILTVVGACMVERGVFGDVVKQNLGLSDIWTPPACWNILQRRCAHPLQFMRNSI